MKIKILRIVAAGAALALLAGCIVLSVYPFYTPKDLVFDPGLAGRWGDIKTPSSVWQFTAGEGKSYMLATTDDKDIKGFEVHLFQLKEFQFLDLLTTNRGEFQMPVHLISKVVHKDANLSLQFMDFDWLAGLLQTNPAVLRHIVVTAPGSTNTSLETGDNKMVYLTAETKDLQKFLLKHADDTNAFSPGSGIELQRLAQ